MMSTEIEEIVVPSSLSNEPKVLILEDQAETAHALAELLSSEHFDVILTSSVPEALQILTTNTPDLIIADICMPGKSGMDFFKEIRQQPQWASIPFIFLSAREGEDLINESIQSGCDHYLKKPIQATELVSVIKGKLLQFDARKKLENIKLEGFKKRVIHTLSHEFRTPLVSITTGAELLLEEDCPVAPSQAKKLLQSILRGGQRLERLVEDFMLLQQIDIGYASQTFKEYRSPISIGEFFDQLENSAEEKFSDIYPDYILRIKSDRELRHLKLEAFPPQLLDAFLRLIDNAFKFSPEQRVGELGVEANDNEFIFSVRDWGEGLPEDYMAEEEAMEKFIQIGRDINEQQGCGIGLSIASYFISLHSGNLKLVRPKGGRGLEVLVRIKRTL